MHSKIKCPYLSLCQYVKNYNTIHTKGFNIIGCLSLLNALIPL